MKAPRSRTGGASPRMGEVDEQAKHELELYLYNTYDLYGQHEAIVANIKRKMRRGVYDHTKAPKLWLYWVDRGARHYVREFGGDVRNVFPKPLRQELAVEIAQNELEKMKI